MFVKLKDFILSQMQFELGAEAKISDNPCPLAEVMESIHMWPLVAWHEELAEPCLFVTESYGRSICFIASEEPVTVNCSDRPLFVLALCGDLRKRDLIGFVLLLRFLGLNFSYAVTKVCEEVFYP